LRVGKKVAGVVRAVRMADSEVERRDGSGRVSFGGSEGEEDGGKRGGMVGRGAAMDCQAVFWVLRLGWDVSFFFPSAGVEGAG
jgi:hypothetical protein